MEPSDDVRGGGLAAGGSAAVGDPSALGRSGHIVVVVRVDAAQTDTPLRSAPLIPCSNNDNN